MCTGTRRTYLVHEQARLSQFHAGAYLQWLFSFELRKHTYVPGELGHQLQKAVPMGRASCTARLKFDNGLPRLLVSCRVGLWWQFDGCFETACDGCRISGCMGCSFDDPLLVPACTDVMEHSNSSGGTVTLEELWIEPGYWRATKTSTDILACYNEDACLGGVTGSADYCLKGHEGPCK